MAGQQQQLAAAAAHADQMQSRMQALEGHVQPAAAVQQLMQALQQQQQQQQRVDTSVL
jgi:hypothetical protein